MELTRRDIFKLTLVATLVVVVGLMALHTEAVGSTFATGSGTGGLELKIDSTVYYNGELQPQLTWEVKNLVPSVDKFFNYPDVKPGDTGTNTISIHVRKNPAWACLDIYNLADEENDINEPESLVDENEGGELSQHLEFFAWFDDNDRIYEVGETPMFGTSSQSAIQVLNDKTYVLADSEHGSPMPPLHTKYIAIMWCAGNLSVNLDTAEVSCDATAMGNEAQTDSMTVDVSIRAISAFKKPNFVCRKPNQPSGGHGGGNNGHGNDEDGNDDSNPGNSNDEDDDTDDDGVPGRPNRPASPASPASPQQPASPASPASPERPASLTNGLSIDSDYTETWEKMTPKNKRPTSLELWYRLNSFFNRSYYSS